MCILYLNGLIKTGAEISFVLSSAYPRWEKKWYYCYVLYAVWFALSGWSLQKYYKILSLEWITTAASRF